MDQPTTVFEQMKTAIRNKVDLDTFKTWNGGLSTSDYKQVATKLGWHWKEVKAYAEAKGLDNLLAFFNRQLNIKGRYATEIEVAEKFRKDTDEIEFPWTSVEKLRNSIDEAMWNRRVKVVNVLFKLAQETVVVEDAEAYRISELKRTGAI